MPFLRIFISSLLWLPLFLTACGSQSSTDEFKKELQTVTSWVATAHLVGDSWERGDVPKIYAKQTIQKAKTELQKEADSLAKKSLPESAILLEHLKHLDLMMAQMSTAIEQEDRNAIAQQIQELSLEEEMLDSLTKTAGTQP